MVVKFPLSNLPWWALAFTLGVASTWLPEFLGVDTRSVLGLVVLHLGLVASGAIVGFFKAERVWRWGIACALALPIMYVLEKASSQSPGSMSVANSIMVAVIKTPVYALQALPALFGAYLGAVARLGVPPPEDIRKTLNAARFWALGFVLAFAAAGIPLISAQLLNPQLNAFHRPFVMFVWGGGLFVAATVMSMLRQNAMWESCIAVILGSIAGVVLKVLVDSLQDPATTQFLSLPVNFSIYFAAPCAFGGALIGTSLRSTFPNLLLRNRGKQGK